MIKLISLILIFAILYSVSRDIDISEQKQCILLLSCIASSLIIGGLIGFTLIIISSFVMDLVLNFVKKIFLDE